MTKTKSISKFVARGVVASQLCLLVFGIVASTYLIPNYLKNDFMSKLDSTVSQAKWAIEKDVSYSNYLATQGYLKKIVQIKPINAAILVGPNNECLAFSDNTTEGCINFGTSKKKRYENKNQYVTQEATFFYQSLGGKKTKHAKLSIVSNLSFLQSTQSRSIFFASLAFLSFFLLSSIIAYYQFRIFRSELLTIRSFIKKMANSKNELTQPSLSFEESEEIHKIVIDTEKKIVKMKDELVRKERETVLGEIASQVAHDIQSPLTALDAVAGICQELPENAKNLVKSATKRIRDITSDLNQKSVRDLQNPTNFGGERCPVHIETALNEILEEKRLQRNTPQKIKIVDNIHAYQSSVFSKIDPKIFARVISNLINNASEAMPNGGIIEVNLNRIPQNSKDQQGIVQISIRDHGIGIPASVLKRLGEKGLTHGKANGSGLGFYYAKMMVTSWGGEIHVSSEINKKTEVLLNLPKIDPPAWHVPYISISEGMTILILDDDPAAYQTWEYRFSTKGIRERHINLVHCDTSESFQNCLLERDNHSPMLCIVDYELGDRTCTGIDTIRKLGVMKKSILVTNRHEKPYVQEQCLALGIGIIPKKSSLSVPIKYTEDLLNV